MGNIIALFIRMPWYGYLVLAVGAGYLGVSSSESSQERADLIQAAIERDAPEVTSIANYTHPKTKFAEARLRAQWVTSHNTELVRRTNGIRTSTSFMIVFADPDAVQEPEEYRAFMILSQQEWDNIQEWILQKMVNIGPLGPVIEVTGEISRSSHKSSHARDALENQGSAMATDEFYIQPYYDGREAGLQALAESASRGSSSNLFQNLTVILIVLAIAKLGYRIHMKRKRREKMAQAQAMVDAQYAGVQSPVAQPAQDRRVVTPKPAEAPGRDIPETVKRF